MGSQLAQPGPATPPPLHCFPLHLPFPPDPDWTAGGPASTPVFCPVQLARASVLLSWAMATPF